MPRFALFSRRIPVLIAVASSLALGVGAALAAPAQAGAAPATSPIYGSVTHAYQQRSGTITVSGYAFDRDHPRATTSVCLVVNDRCVLVIRPHLPSPTFNKAHHLSGGHRFEVLVQAPRPTSTIALRTNSPRPVTLDRASVSTAGDRIVEVASRYVSHARYVEGGASPRTGFDCSGYVLYSYRSANVASLPHNAEAQRHVKYMRHITQAQARPGDLVFYFSGGPAFHVAIYAGRGMQYAAATPQDGIRLQPIWSSNVEFRTNWH